MTRIAPDYGLKWRGISSKRAARPRGPILPVLLQYIIATLAAAQAPSHAQPALPDYPRVQIGELFLASRDPEHPHRRDQAPFVVLGMVEHDHLPDRSFTLAAPFVGCCSTHGFVRFRVAPSDEALEFEPGAWVAIFGRLASDEVIPPRRGVARFSQIVAPVPIIPEHIVPARSIRTGPCVTDSLQADSLSIFRGILEASGLGSDLAAADGVVVLAPINAAFDHLTQSERTALDEPADPAELRQFVLRHIVPEDLTREELRSQPSVRSAAHAELPIELSPQFRIAGARVLFVDSSSRNGIVCIIDRVVQEEAEPDADDRTGLEPGDPIAP